MKFMGDTKALKSGEMNLTKGNPYSLILRFALPLFISQLFQQLYNTADTFIVGRYLGTEALAAVSSSGTLIFMMISFFEGMFMGAGVLISRYYGADNPSKVSRAVHTNMALGLISGVILTVVGVVFTPTFLVWMKTDPEVLPQAVEYFRFYFAGSLSLVLYNVCRGVMMAVGDSKRPLYYLVTSSLLNIALDLLFVGVFGWGVWSAAVATVIAQSVSAILCLIRLMRKGGAVKVSFRKLRLHGDMLMKIVKYGLPSGVQNSVIAFANVIVQSNINSFGKIATAAYGTHAKIEGFAFMPIMSFNMAITTFIGQNLGAKEYDRAKKGARFGIISAMLLAELVGVVYFVFAPQLISLFDSTAGVVAFGARQARTVTLFYFLLAFSHSVAAVCRGAGKAFVPMLVMLGIWCVVRISYIVTVMHFYHNIGHIYWAYPITWAISSVIYLIYYLKSNWVYGFEKSGGKDAV